MDPRKLAPCAWVGALAFALTATDASALTIARVTRHGYIMVDEPDAPFPYEGRVPVGNTEGLFGIISDIATVIDRTEGAPRGDIIAVMQIEVERQALAFYLGLRNDVQGIGIRSPVGNREIYDYNPMLGTPFTITGFVFLNSIRYYTNPALENFGRYLICTQEFGHRYGVHIRVPPRPGMPTPGPDSMDAGTGDAMTDHQDGEPPDASPPDLDLPPDILLGRQRAHWSYFVHTGGSPMEGNNWEEISPGVFRTGRVSFRFSPLDLYLMGLIPPSEVPPFFVIVEPDTMGQRDINGQRITRESPPEYAGTPVTIRGRRVTYTIDDIIRANGPRIPPYRDPDAGTNDGGDAGPSADPDLRVIWVLLATVEDVNDRLAQDFDRAIETCTRGYDEATGERSHLLAQVVTRPDAGYDGGTDAAVDALPWNDASLRDASGQVDPSLVATGGCACRTALAHEPTKKSLGLSCTFGILAMGLHRRRAARTHRETRKAIER